MKEYKKNPYSKRMRSSKKRYVATTPAGKQYEADTQEEMTKLLKDNGLIKPKPVVKTQPSGLSSEKPIVAKPQFDPNTGERTN